MSYSNQNVQTRTSKNVICFLYSIICYVASLIALLSMICFVSDIFPQFTVNNRHQTQPFENALMINLGLFALFGIQHSVMARKSFKNWINKYIHRSVERSTYCLATSVVILFMLFLWQPMPEVVWAASSETSHLLIIGFAVFGWIILLWATFQLDHFELFGLLQTWSLLRGKALPEVRFKKPFLYRIVRHPIQTGILIGIWSVPVSTVSHLVFVSGMTIYVFIGLYFEEKDLIREFGVVYQDYKKRVGGIFPFIG